MPDYVQHPGWHEPSAYRPAILDRFVKHFEITDGNDVVDVTSYNYYIAVRDYARSKYGEYTVVWRIAGRFGHAGEFQYNTNGKPLEPYDAACVLKVRQYCDE